MISIRRNLNLIFWILSLGLIMVGYNNCDSVHENLLSLDEEGLLSEGDSIISKPKISIVRKGNFSSITDFIITEVIRESADNVFSLQWKNPGEISLKSINIYIREIDGINEIGMAYKIIDGLNVSAIPVLDAVPDFNLETIVDSFVFSDVERSKLAYYIYLVDDQGEKSDLIQMLSWKDSDEVIDEIISGD